MTRPWWQGSRKIRVGPVQAAVLEALLPDPAESLEDLYHRLHSGMGYPAHKLGKSVNGLEKKGLVKTTWRGCGYPKGVELTDRGRRATEKLVGRKFHRARSGHSANLEEGRIVKRFIIIAIILLAV